MTIIYLSIAWFTGIVLAEVLELPLPVPLTVGVLALGAALLARKQAALRIIFAACLFAALGAARLVVDRPQIDQEDIAYYNGGPPVSIVGEVVGEPERLGASTRVEIAAEQLTLSGDRQRAVQGLVQVTLSALEDVRYGDRLHLSGRLESPRIAQSAEAAAYLARRDVFSVLDASEVAVLSGKGGNHLYHAILALKRRTQVVINRQLPGPPAALLSGILLGNDSQLAPDVKEAFQRTGTSHIIAISGFNIAILAGIFLAVGQPAVGPRRAACVALVGIGVYAILVGADAAVVRAAIMGGLLIVATRLLGRPTFAPAGLFTAGMLMTIANPHLLWDVSFQLSFAATLGLMVFVGPATRGMHLQLQRGLSPQAARQTTAVLSEVVIATLAATAMTLPITLYQFEKLSLISPLANLIILPVQPAVMLWGGLAALVGLVLPALGQVVAWVAWLFLSFTIASVELLARPALASIDVRMTLAAAAGAYLLLLAAGWYIHQQPEARAVVKAALQRHVRAGVFLSAGGIVALLAVSWGLSQPDGQLHVAFLDVRDGYGAYVQTPSGRQILIDGGGSGSELLDELDRQVAFWDGTLDLVLLTSSDKAKHIVLSDVLRTYRVARVLVPQDAAGTLRLEGTTVEVVDTARQVAVGDGVALEVVPVAVTEQATRLIPQVSYGNLTLTLLGDVRVDAVAKALSEEQLAQPVSVVLKSGKLGQVALDAGLVERLQPQIAVFTDVGQDGWPEEAFNLLDAHGVSNVVTDATGTLELISDGKQMWWLGEHGNNNR